MGTSSFSDDFKRDAVHQIRVRGYPVQIAFRNDMPISRSCLTIWTPCSASPR